MKRIERAKIIHRTVMEIAESSPDFQYVNSGLAMIAENPFWHARIHTINNMALGQWWPRLVSVPNSPELTLGRRKLPNRMGLWLANGPKVLTVEWLNDRFELIHMCRGSWEHELFNLPEYAGPAALKEWQFYRRRSRRWQCPLRGL